MNHDNEETSVPKYLCPKCMETIGYLGWFWTLMRIPGLRHECHYTQIKRQN